MLRRLLIPAIAALMLATPAMAQKFPGQSSWDDSSQRGRGRDKGGQEEQQQPQQQQQREVPLSNIIREIKSQYGGQLLDSDRNGNRWRIAWIAGDGRRLTIEADAETGRITSVR